VIILKIINEPIKVIAIFTKEGKIEPVKFWYEDQAVMVEKILKSYEDKNLGKNNIMFVCQHRGSDIYELKYDIKNNTWYMFKK
jgi:hypothetical protein